MRRRRILAAMLAVSLGLLVRPVGVTPVFACSCAMDADPIATAARDPQQAVFTGIVQGPTAGGTPVVLTRWFGGPAPQPVVWLDNAGSRIRSAGCAAPPDRLPAASGSSARTGPSPGSSG